MYQQKISNHRSQQGVVILEALIALVIFSMGVLALVGLQAAMIKNTGDAKFRADASFIAQQRIGMLWADPVNASTHLEANTPIAILPNGKVTVTQPAAGQFRVIVGWTEPGETPASSATTAPCFMTVAHCYTTIASIAGG
ncbi:MAG TPA: prepilin-type cleavage/methylation domain-containing protein [Methylotenera sp.]|nr:prepilin-type cleavage/methylation domain-containing protein [Methylotenera sp.]